MPRKYASMADRIIANSMIADGTGCWIWTGKRRANQSGYWYGRVTVRDGARVMSLLAHRVALETFTGVKLRKGEVVLHACDNPLCVNPEHLSAGTQQQNVRDAVKKKRHRGAVPLGATQS